MSNEKLYERLTPFIESVSNTVARQWNGVIEAEDLKQDLWLFIFENKSAQNYFRMTKDPKKVRAALNRRAQSIASKERLDYDRFHGQWFYTVKEVKVLLRTLVEGSDVSSVELMDLSEALDGLIDSYRNTVIAYARGETKGGNNQQRLAVRNAFKTLVARMNTARNVRVNNAYRPEGLGTRPTPKERKKNYGY